jgi:AI-2 transport protein TqsA
MEPQAVLSRELRIMLATACFIIIIAGMRASAGILVPFLFSVFIAIICTPPLFWLQNRGVPKLVAISLIMLVLLAAGYMLAAFIRASVSEFTASVSGYQETLAVQASYAIEWLTNRGIVVSEETINEYLDPAIAIQMTGIILTSISAVLTNAFMIGLTVLFILLEASGMPVKYRAAFKRPEKSLQNIKRFTKSVNHYLALKTVFSLLTGILISTWLIILDLDYAILWGLLAFILNFVPNIGSIIAAIPAILIALIQLGFWPAMAVMAGFVFVNTIIGNILEPRFMGRGLGLSTLVVFLSLVFWGWVLGYVGMLLSVPLTMIFKIAMESHEETYWLAVMLGNEPVSPPQNQGNDTFA